MKTTVLSVIILSLFQASCVSSTYPVSNKKLFTDGSKAERHTASKVGKNENSRSLISSPPTCEEQFNDVAACLRKTFNNLSCDRFVIWWLLGSRVQCGSLIGQICLQENTLPDFKEKCRQEINYEVLELMKNAKSELIDRCQ